ncbi:MAG: hypothetical protein AB7N71_00125 [Phycisphaerae bacterium]
MKIRLSRISGDRHRLAIVRSDGSCSEAEFETRSVLFHDLVHYAIEAEAGIPDGFWGLLAAGADFADLDQHATDAGRGIALAESLVGPFQTLWKGGLVPDEYIRLFADAAPFVDQAFVKRVRERLRKLWGHWQGTPFHETMEITWPAET